jgi:NADH:ubiquinone oxidoreductase subunit 3 (subunit A)
MRQYTPALVLLLVALGGVAAVYAAHLATAVDREPLRAGPYLSGGLPDEHAWSRYHARYYALTLLFLAFDVEMLFMYPWALVVAEEGLAAVVEMFGFLGVLLVGVLYAWREGALRWA